MVIGLNKSIHIYVSDYDTNLEGIDESLVPHGFGGLIQPTSVTGSAIPTVSFVTAQVNTLGVFDQNVHYGFDFGKTKYDNKGCYNQHHLMGLLVLMLFQLWKICLVLMISTLGVTTFSNAIQVKNHIITICTDKGNSLYHFKVVLMEMYQQH